MEPATLPPMASAAGAGVGVASTKCADSISYSPRGRQTDSCDSELQLPARQLKLRLMCSYGGHIVPRPHDKSLCYVGGDTRIVVVDRLTSVADLHHRLFKTLLLTQTVTLKYQLPSEDLDSLISVTVDEDLENMIEEYDRLNSDGGGSKSGRIRLFLFPNSSIVDQVLAETASIKSEDWFLNMLNGGKATLSVAASDHGLSESSTVNCLLGLDEGLSGKSGLVEGVESRVEDTKGCGENTDRNGSDITIINQEMHSVPGSPMLETSSSFGSTASTPSMVNLPPIRVRVGENPKVGEQGVDEHFQQMSVGGGNTTLPRPRPETGADAAMSGLPVSVGGEYSNTSNIVCDDERSDHGGYKMAPQVLQHTQIQAQYQPQQALFQQIPAAANGLASPDSISSDGGVTNSLSRQKQTVYQEQILQMQTGAEMKPLDKINSTIQPQPQVQESSYVLPRQYDQSYSLLEQRQPFIHGGLQYIPAGAVPMTPQYYPVYPSEQQPNPHSSMLDQQYPIYLVPARQSQSRNLPVQSQSYCGFTTSVSSLQAPLTTIIHPQSYNHAQTLPPQPEMVAGMYRTTAVAPQSIQVSSNQYPSQFLGFSQVHQSSQLAPPTSTFKSTHSSEFADLASTQIYVSQPLPPQFVAQYQTLTSTTAAVSPEISAQLAMEHMKNQVGTLQP